jgi:hypothetical protein
VRPAGFFGESLFDVILKTLRLPVLLFCLQQVARDLIGISK